ncbi:unnamed protein product [Rotaria socialis]|uniref:Uncharacterized protein n=1 Tax=Rotaria socialis TaxID=392032 RepID=A0A817P4A5_9BILA|nr:unnamed protein product [Rotaria socialis]CAF3182332.1 unnamed protein product [Rotaria socialis]CAF3380351.1 unnamed protein product [Rotaria socialis]CAF3412943.1 unnamed protein product [Rotaria socialis]CAF4123633.1 unnamed protein product [Rotaria socialis]
MNRGFNPVEVYYNRDLHLHKPGVIPKASRRTSAITSSRHKYELKQELGTNKTIESWFENHSPQERQTVYSFLDTLYKSNNVKDKKVQNSRLYNRVRTASAHSSRRQLLEPTQRDNQTSKHNIGQLVESLESFRLSTSVQEKGIPTASNDSAIQSADVNQRKSDANIETNSVRPSTATIRPIEKMQSENNSDNQSTTTNRRNLRYLSQSWRVINPQDDIQLNPRSDNNTSSFFNYTKKAYPEYYFIHPDWY